MASKDLEALVVFIRDKVSRASDFKQLITQSQVYEIISFNPLKVDNVLKIPTGKHIYTGTGTAESQKIRSIR